MERIGSEWLGELAADAALTADQEGSILKIVKDFIAAYEGLRWRRGVEEDIETTIERLYEKAEQEIRSVLGAGQTDGFRGLPRDWGFGKLDPAPGR
jgi:hypothetical protein